MLDSQATFRFRSIRGVNGITEHLIKAQKSNFSPPHLRLGECPPTKISRRLWVARKWREKKAALKQSPYWENYGLRELIGCGPCPLRRQTLGTATHDAVGQHQPGRPFQNAQGARRTHVSTGLDCWQGCKISLLINPVNTFQRVLAVIWMPTMDLRLYKKFF